MSNKQWQIVILWVGTGLIVLMGLLPPWILVRHPEAQLYNPARERVGYYWVFNPPEPRDFRRGHRGSCHVNIAYLLIQWAITVSVAGAVIYTIRIKGKQSC